MCIRDRDGGLFLALMKYLFAVLLEGRRDGVRLPGLEKQQVVAGAYLVEGVIHMKFLCNPVQVFRGSHIGHGIFRPVVRCV